MHVMLDSANQRVVEEVFAHARVKADLIREGGVHFFFSEQPREETTIRSWMAVPDEWLQNPARRHRLRVAARFFRRRVRRVGLRNSVPAI